MSLRARRIDIAAVSSPMSAIKPVENQIKMAGVTDIRTSLDLFELELMVAHPFSREGARLDASHPTGETDRPVVGVPAPACWVRQAAVSRYVTDFHG